MRALLTLVALATPLFGEQPFVDYASQAGLEFTHTAGDTGEYHLPEIMGSGVALLDYDKDGDLDVYLLQGDGPNQLFRNDLKERKPQFTNVTEESGLGHPGFGMGVAIGDYDGDGDSDAFVTNFGADALFENRGGKFRDVTAKTGLGDEAFGASATFFDYDRDGDLDLFVTRYVAFTRRANKRCQGHIGEIDYCSPLEYPPLPDKLYRNDAGFFRDVTVEVGLDMAFGNGLGVVARDLDANDLLDVFVANDQAANQLWLGAASGRFTDDALLAGVAYNLHGEPEAGMGIAAGDYDNDGDLDLFVTHLRGQTNTLYRSDGAGSFDDATNTSGLGTPSVPMTGFGAGWLDYDNDGWLDLFVANGDVRRSSLRTNGPFPYGQPNQLFHNVEGRFEAEALPGSRASRGAAFGDIDLDGDVDIVVSNANGPAELLLNQVGASNDWLAFRLSGPPGAQVKLERVDAEPLWRWPASDGSYLSSNSQWAHFGLAETTPEAIVVRWPDRSRERWIVEQVNQSLVLAKGAGEAVE